MPPNDILMKKYLLPALFPFFLLSCGTGNGSGNVNEKKDSLPEKTDTSAIHSRKEWMDFIMKETVALHFPMQLAVDSVSRFTTLELNDAQAFVIMPETFEPETDFTFDALAHHVYPDGTQAALFCMTNRPGEPSPESDSKEIFLLLYRPATDSVQTLLMAWNGSGYGRAVFDSPEKVRTVSVDAMEDVHVTASRFSIRAGAFVQEEMIEKSWKAGKAGQEESGKFISQFLR